MEQEVIELIQKVGMWAPAIFFILSFGALLWVTADSKEAETMEAKPRSKN